MPRKAAQQSNTLDSSILDFPYVGARGAGRAACTSCEEHPSHGTREEGLPDGARGLRWRVSRADVQHPPVLEQRDARLDRQGRRRARRRAVAATRATSRKEGRPLIHGHRPATRFSWLGPRWPPRRITQRRVVSPRAAEHDPLGSMGTPARTFPVTSSADDPCHHGRLADASNASCSGNRRVPILRAWRRWSQPTRSTRSRSPPTRPSG